MKITKALSLILPAFIISNCNTVIFAENTITGRDNLCIDFYIKNVQNIKSESLTLGLYSADNELLDTKNLYVSTPNSSNLIVFDVPQYELGSEFYLEYISGEAKVQYYNTEYSNGEKILLQTFYDYKADNEKIVWGNSFSMSVNPVIEKSVSLSLNTYNTKTILPIKYNDGNYMISLPDIVSLFDVNLDTLTFDESMGRLEFTIQNKIFTFLLGSTKGYINYVENDMCAAPVKLDDILYVPLDFVFKAMGAGITASDKEYSVTIYADLLLPKFARQNNAINSIDMYSKTDYLIWVSKPSYTVTVFRGSNRNWRALASMPCSIGAPATPTVTGQFEYFSKEKQWSYPGYYVGPIMRFYSGYALHSTLIRYDGSAYDARVGKQISHGCVRMRPQDIQWTAATVPLHTKVYVTNW